MENMTKRYQAYAEAVKKASGKNPSERMEAYKSAAAPKGGKKSILARLQEGRK